MMKLKNLSLAVVAGLALPATGVYAAALASDNAGNYTGSYAGGANGTGFTAFVPGTNNVGDTGTFLGNSTNNAGSSGGINSPNGTAFGIYANNGGSENVIRQFQADSNFQLALSVGQTFSIDLDNGYVANGSNVGFNLLNANNTGRFTFQFFGGAATYVYNTGGNNVDTGIAYTANGLHLTFTQLAANAYSASVTPYNANGTLGTATVLAGTVTASDITQFQVFDNNAAAGDTANSKNYDVFFNNLAIVPEPGTLSVVALGLAGLGLVVRRRRRD